MPGMSGLDLVREVSRRGLSTQVLLVTGHATVATAVEALRHGAFDYLEKPFDADKLEASVRQALQQSRLIEMPAESRLSAENRGLCEEDLPLMIGASTIMRDLRARIACVAATDETVLISGESGTGKELVAQMIHRLSRRAAGPLVSLNCPVLSAQLMESELFGHERGAFTGADSRRVGRFELADGGTLLLDEVTEIDLNLQAKLLRVLQERCFERVGASTTIRVDTRVLSTTNRDLRQAIAAGVFREDLYYRLAVVPLELPPLRARRSDVRELIDHFLAKAVQRLGQASSELDVSAYELLEEYEWPGNVRELQNLILRACVLHPHKRIAADDLRRWLQPSEGESSDPPRLPAPGVGTSLADVERRHIELMLEHFGGHREKTARALGIGVRTLSGKLRQYGYAAREKTFAARSQIDAATRLGRVA
jgi:DNA-binding NtrC family response regulator